MEVCTLVVTGTLVCYYDRIRLSGTYGNFCVVVVLLCVVLL